MVFENTRPMFSYEGSSYLYFVLSVSILLKIISWSLTIQFIGLVIIVIVLIIVRNQVLFAIRSKSALDQQRKDWLNAHLNYILRQNGHAGESIMYDIKEILDMPDRYEYFAELFPIPLEQRGVPIIPDITEAENELVLMEQRVAKLLVTLVSAPILFTVLHFLFPITIPSILLSGLILFIVIDLITFSTRQVYKLIGWATTLGMLREVKFLFQKDPFNALTKMSDLYSNVYTTEIGIEAVIAENSPSHQAVGSLLQAAISTDLTISGQLIDEFLDITKDLPKIEQIHHQKWRVYSSQFLVISIAIIFFSAILGAISKVISYLLLRLHSQDSIITFIAINPNYYTAEFTMILTLIITYHLSQPFFDKKTRRSLLILWTSEYLTILYSITLIFQSQIIS
ncbi:MAG: hypothetical protein ACW98K_07405 [Candidatus Kariarchaeaceae archaeon]